MIGPNGGAPSLPDSGSAQLWGRALADGGNGTHAGYSNATLLAALALLAVITLLSLIQQGEIDPLAFAARPAPPAGAQKRKGKLPPLLPSTQPVAQAPAAEGPGMPARHAPNPQREMAQALGRMDGRAAAALLTELSPQDAVTLLSRLRERELALILEEAHPADAAGWIEELLALPVPSEPLPMPAAPGALPTTEAEAESAADTAAAGAAEEPATGMPSADTSINSQEDVSGSGSESADSGGASAHHTPSTPQPETSIA